MQFAASFYARVTHYSVLTVMTQMTSPIRWRVSLNTWLVHGVMKQSDRARNAWYSPAMMSISQLQFDLSRTAAMPASLHPAGFGIKRAEATFGTMPGLTGGAVAMRPQQFGVVLYATNSDKAEGPVMAL